MCKPKLVVTYSHKFLRPIGNFARIYIILNFRLRLIFFISFSDYIEKCYDGHLTFHWLLTLFDACKILGHKSKYML